MSAFLFGVPGKLKTLLDRLTADRAGYLDRLDAAVSTRAAASTALSSATWTGTRAAKLDEVGIKSIQRGTIVVSAGATSTASNTATISAVATGKAVALFLGMTVDSGVPDIPGIGRVELTNGTTVTATASNLGTGTIGYRIGYAVVEFN